VAERPERVLDLFAGAGGWENATGDGATGWIGVDNATTVWPIRRILGRTTIRGDVTRESPDDYVTAGFTGMVASPPCQRFSPANHHNRGRGEVRRGVREALRAGDTLLEPLRWTLALRPDWTAWEQVPVVLPVWEYCAGVLRQEGYAVSCAVLHSHRYGAATSRARAVLWARKNPAGGVMPWPREHPGTSMVDALGGLLPDGAAALCKKPGFAPVNPHPVTGSAPSLAFGKDAAAWHWDTGERLDPVQAAALQGFTHEQAWLMRSVASPRSMWQAVGNAVPAALATAVLEAVRNP